MPSKEHEAVVAMLEANPIAEVPTLDEQRAAYEEMLGASPIPGDVSVDEFTIKHVNCDWVTAPGSDEYPVILYLHGGGYVIGSNVAYREFGGRLARATGARVCLVNYRLAPENPFPAAVEDATMAYRWLLSQGVPAAKIAIAGDSAGGGLTLATLFALREAGDPLPGCAVTFSPWTDLKGTGASAVPGAVDDPLIGDAILNGMAAYYAGEDLENPLASPLYGDFTKLPPLLIQVGSREVLLDDARRVRDKAQAAGVSVEYFEGDELIHVWPVLAPTAPESAAALDSVAAFVRASTS